VTTLTDGCEGKYLARRRENKEGKRWGGEEKWKEADNRRIGSG